MKEQQISLSQDLHDIRYVNASNNVNAQVILIKYTNNQKYIYNFNGDIEEDIIGVCGRSQVLMQLIGCKIDKWYKRSIYIDPEIKIIIKEMTNNEIVEYQERTNDSQPNNNGHENQDNFLINGNISEIIVTFERRPYAI